MTVAFRMALLNTVTSSDFVAVRVMVKFVPSAALDGTLTATSAGLDPPDGKFKLCGVTWIG